MVGVLTVAAGYDGGERSAMKVRSNIFVSLAIPSTKSGGSLEEVENPLAN
jgi:hypothetical protein